jgi:hypothetical protein
MWSCFFVFAPPFVPTYLPAVGDSGYTSGGNTNTNFLRPHDKNIQPTTTTSKLLIDKKCMFHYYKNAYSFCGRSGANAVRIAGHKLFVLWVQGNRRVQGFYECGINTGTFSDSCAVAAAQNKKNKCTMT